MYRSEVFHFYVVIFKYIEQPNVILILLSFFPDSSKTRIYL